jgi:hypothetical protein
MNINFFYDSASQNREFRELFKAFLKRRERVGD